MLFPHGAEKTFLIREFEEPGATLWRDVPDPIGLGAKFMRIAPARSKMRCRACSVSLNKVNWFRLVRREIAEYLRTQ